MSEKKEIKIVIYKDQIDNEIKYFISNNIKGSPLSYQIANQGVIDLEALEIVIKLIKQAKKELNKEGLKKIE